MEKVVILTVLLAVCYGALAQSSDIPTETPVPTSTPTPAPSLPPLKNQTFVLPDYKNPNVTCLRMVIAVSINITYTDSAGKNQTITNLRLTDEATQGGQSNCSVEAATAELYVEMDDMDPPLYLVFVFNGSSQEGWSFVEVKLFINVDLLFNDYNRTTGILEFNTTDRLSGNSNSKIGYGSSYSCASNQTLTYNENALIWPNVTISQLQAQAFSFQNSTSGEFDKPRMCVLDNTGSANKIVPIAVGAALAGLVVVVLIAYLIGRLRSRRQSSYEALS